MRLPKDRSKPRVGNSPFNRILVWQLDIAQCSYGAGANLVAQFRYLSEISSIISTTIVRWLEVGRTCLLGIGTMLSSFIVLWGANEASGQIVAFGGGLQAAAEAGIQPVPPSPTNK